jgi:hypothetical protein
LLTIAIQRIVFWWRRQAKVEKLTLVRADERLLRETDLSALLNR